MEEFVGSPEYKAIEDSIICDFEAFQKFFDKQYKKFIERTEDEKIDIICNAKTPEEFAKLIKGIFN